MRDMLGREIHVGDVVAYPNREGSSLWQVVGRIEQLDEACSRAKVLALAAYGWSTEYTARWVGVERMVLTHGTLLGYTINKHDERIHFPDHERYTGTVKRLEETNGEGL